MSDRVKYGEVNLYYCQTDNMIGGYFTNPLKWDKFRKSKDKILNIQISYDAPVTTSGDIPQQCYEDWLYKWVELEVKNVVYQWFESHIISF